MKLIIVLLMTGGLVVLVCYLRPQLNFRDMPKALCSGKLSKDKPNWVSSLVEKEDPHYISPLKIESMSQLATAMRDTIAGITIVSEADDKILAYRQSSIFHFTDWLCIKTDGNITSSATLGYSDFKQNRRLVEHIRRLTIQVD